jgi:hypothetical protein
MASLMGLALLLVLLIPALMWWGGVIGPVVGPVAGGMVGAFAEALPSLVYIGVAIFVAVMIVIPFLQGLGWLRATEEKAALIPPEPPMTPEEQAAKLHADNELAEWYLSNIKRDRLEQEAYLRRLRKGDEPC